MKQAQLVPWLRKGVLGGFFGGLEHNGTGGQTDRVTFVLLGLLSEPCWLPC